MSAGAIRTTRVLNFTTGSWPAETSRLKWTKEIPSSLAASARVRSFLESAGPSERPAVRLSVFGTARGRLCRHEVGRLRIRAPSSASAGHAPEETACPL
jgi:hypothetical protein